MTDQDEELFDHEVTAWTAGALRKALDGVPDDMPVRVITAEEPGGDLAAEQVVIGGQPWGGGTGPPDHFEISCEFPPGQYYRRTR
jgi:hypothetical protein